MNEEIESVSALTALPEAAQMPAVGERLSAARKARGLSVDEVAAALKLGPRQVAALEAGDWQQLPGNTFIRGFARNYARYLDLDAAVLMAELDAVLKKPADTLKVDNVHPAAMPAHGSSALFHKSSRMMVYAIGAGLVVLIALLVGNASSLASAGRELLAAVSGQKPAEPAVAPESAPAPATAPAQEPVLPPGTTPQQVLRPQALLPAEPVPAQAAAVVAAPSLRIVLAKESLLEVRDAEDKVIFFQRQLPGGSTQEFSLGGPVTVTLGQAAGAHVVWKGREIDLAPYIKGNAARLVLE